MPAIRKIIVRLTLMVLLLLQSILPSFAQTSVTQNTSVSLTVSLRDQDIPLTIARTSDNPTAAEDELITYQITYGSLLSFAVPLTISASWADASINGSLVTLADYVNGSGTNAYNGTPAVIDTVNKKVSWSIPSIPANTTDQIVSFQLRTNSNHTSSDQVSFIVSANAESSGATITPVSLTQYYKHTQPSTDSPTSTPTPQPARSSPTPTPTKLVPLFSSVDIESISSTSATARISLNIPSKLIIRYGTTPSSLTKTIRVPELVTNYSPIFPELTPKTPYYFTITAINATSSMTSDIYTFMTANGVQSSSIDLSTLIITTNNTILTSSKLSQEKGFLGRKNIPTTVITIDTPFEFQFAVTDAEKIRKIQAIVRHAKVLGINTYAYAKEPDASTESVEITEIARGVYNGLLKSKPLPGTYTLIARISDSSGNITEQPIAEITAVNPLTILDAQTHLPIENARILISRKQPRTNRYTLLAEQSIAMQNPIYTESDGTIRSNLIQGEYKVHISATGYTPLDQEFTISSLSDEEYPTIYLKHHAFSIISSIQFYGEVIGDVFNSFSSYLATMVGSNRLFKLASLVILCFFVIVTTLSFCIRFHIPVSALPAYFFSYLHLNRNKKTMRILSGTIRDESTGFPVHNAIIYLLDQKRKRILLHTQTNSLGQFTLSLPPASAYLLMVKKRHYLTAHNDVSSFEAITLTLTKDPSLQNRFIEALQFFWKNLLGLLFEMLLFLSFILELIFAMSFGVMIVMPYLILTVINLAMWLFFVRSQRSMYTS